MTQPMWKDLVLPSAKEDLLYELFHENSKLGRHTQQPPKEAVLDQMKHLYSSLPYDGYPRIDLPRPIPLPDIPLFHVMQSRMSVRSIIPDPISLLDLAILLHFSYGVTRAIDETSHERGLRVVPSAGALYPLEIYLYSAHLKGHQPGIFHYNAGDHCLHCLRAADLTQEISEAMVQPEIGMTATALLFITALFERSTFKYQDRGYRFVLMEAGHVAQNVNLAAVALNFSSVNIGGFFDREMDTLLGLDGVTSSTLYIVAIGGSSPPSDQQASLAPNFGNTGGPCHDSGSTQQ